PAESIFSLKRCCRWPPSAAAAAAAADGGASDPCAATGSSSVSPYCKIPQLSNGGPAALLPPWTAFPTAAAPGGDFSVAIDGSWCPPAAAASPESNDLRSSAMSPL
ncbi:unnamed protein product, partial [Ectocarpus sp. 12 AP-2014]